MASFDVPAGNHPHQCSNTLVRPPSLYQLLWQAWSEHGDTDIGQRVDWETVQTFLNQIQHSDAAIRAANYTNPQHDQMRLLHFAVALSPPLDVIRRIVDLNPGAVVATSRIGGLTPLMIACGRDAPLPVLRHLMERDDRALARVDQSGFAPIHWACRQNVNEEAVKLILQKDPLQATRSVDVEDEDDEHDSTTSHATKPLQMLAQQYKASCTPSSTLWPWPRNQRLKVSYVLWARHYRSITSARTSSMYSTLHSALALASKCPADIPYEVMELAVRCNADSASDIRDTSGNLPLHYAVSCRSSNGELVTGCHIQKLLEAFPLAASTRDPAGVLPLHRAIQSGRSWHKDGVKDIYECYPKAAQLWDPLVKLPPALSAIVHNTELDTTFNLLRAFPEFVCTR
jgi:ankyrin repeat protein